MNSDQKLCKLSQDSKLRMWRNFNHEINEHSSQLLVKKILDQNVRKAGDSSFLSLKYNIDDILVIFKVFIRYNEYKTFKSNVFCIIAWKNVVTISAAEKYFIEIRIDFKLR